MTTKATKPVTRESGAFVREKGFRPLIVTISGGVLLLRPKGLRGEEVLDLGHAYYLAVKQRVSRDKAEKAAARKARKGK